MRSLVLTRFPLPYLSPPPGPGNHQDRPSSPLRSTILQITRLIRGSAENSETRARKVSKQKDSRRSVLFFYSKGGYPLTSLAIAGKLHLLLEPPDSPLRCETTPWLEGLRFEAVKCLGISCRLLIKRNAREQCPALLVVLFPRIPPLYLFTHGVLVVPHIISAWPSANRKGYI